MVSYRELQEKAKELGLRYVGVSEKELRKSIKEALSSEKSSKETPPKDADAVVYQGKRRVRVYSLEQHGQDYIKLAEQFVSHPERKDYRIEFEKVESRITCPYCGKKFRSSWHYGNYGIINKR